MKYYTNCEFGQVYTATPVKWHTIHGGGGKSVSPYWHRPHTAFICWISSTPHQSKNVFKRKTLLFQECYYSSGRQSASGFGVVGKNLKMPFPSNRFLPALCLPRSYSVCDIILKRQYVHIILRISTHLAAPKWLTQEFRNSQSLVEALHNE